MNALALIFSYHQDLQSADCYVLITIIVMKAHCLHCGEMDNLDEVSRLIATIFSMIKLEKGEISLGSCEMVGATKSVEFVFQEIFAGATSHELLDVYLILNELARSKYEPVTVLEELIKNVVRKQDEDTNKSKGTKNFNYGWFGL